MVPPWNFDIFVHIVNVLQFLEGIFVLQFLGGIFVLQFLGGIFVLQLLGGIFVLQFYGRNINKISLSSIIYSYHAEMALFYF